MMSVATTKQSSYDVPLVNIEGVELEFVDRHGNVTRALNRIDLEIVRGEFCTIVGPSGCGKSTLLNVIAALVTPTKGNVQVDGKPVVAGQRSIGYMFQNNTLLPWATVLENVRLPLDVYGKKDDERCMELLKLVGVADFAHAYPWQLSGGMSKRVQLARALAQEPDILLMDEPFGALDAQTKLLLQEELLKIWEKTGLTILFVTHDLQEAIGLSDRVLLFSARPGRIKEAYDVPLPRPRNLEQIVQVSAFSEMYTSVWRNLKEEIRGGERR